MMRRALEEDQYSALGSVVDTDSSDDDGGDEEDYYESSIRWNHRPKRNSSSGDVAGSKHQPWMNNKGTTTQKKVDRNTIMIAMRKHLRLESMKSVRNFDGTAFMEDAEEYLVRGGSGSKRSRSLSPRPSSTNNKIVGGEALRGEEEEEEDLAVDGRRIGKRRKKKKKGGKVVGAASSSGQLSDVPNESGTGGVDTPMSGSGNDDGGGDWEDGKDDSGGGGGTAAAKDANDGDFIPEEEEISIFGQTAGASNATWVECDRCKKVSL